MSHHRRLRARSRPVQCLCSAALSSPSLLLAPSRQAGRPRARKTPRLQEPVPGQGSRGLKEPSREVVPHGVQDTTRRGKGQGGDRPWRTRLSAPDGPSRKRREPPSSGDGLSWKRREPPSRRGWRDGNAIGRLRSTEAERIEVLNLAAALARSPESIAALLEGAGHAALVPAGKLLARGGLSASPHQKRRHHESPRTHTIDAGVVARDRD